MSHHTTRDGYEAFQQRINRFPQGAPPSETLYKIMAVLVTEREAATLSALPIRPFTARKAARALKQTVPETEAALAALCEKAMLMDVVRDGKETEYVMPPPMAGFLEFALMRVRDDIDQKLLSELYHQYMGVESEMMTALFWGTETKLGRTFVREDAITPEIAVHVLDMDRASQVIETAEHIGIGMCYCRHKAQHLGTACDAPMDVCMTFGNTADSLSRHGYARSVSKTEALEALALVREANLVHCGENVQAQLSFLCNCCGCCCEAMLAQKRWGMGRSVETTPFLPCIDAEKCTGCGKCVRVCPVDAIKMETARRGERDVRTAKVDEAACLGCGVCTRNCHKAAISLKYRGERVITPVSGAHRIVLAAIEKGQLSNLLFDTPALESHRVMGALLTAVLKLPPVTRALASRQVKSRYLARILR